MKRTVCPFSYFCKGQCPVFSQPSYEVDLKLQLHNNLKIMKLLMIKKEVN